MVRKYEVFEGGVGVLQVLVMVEVEIKIQEGRKADVRCKSIEVWQKRKRIRWLIMLWKQQGCGS